MRKFLFPLFLLVPASALALNLSNSPVPFADVRASSPAMAGVRLLYGEGVVNGVRKDFFGVSRRISRSEAVKIALLSSPKFLRFQISKPGSDCFRDVRTFHWFAPYVCYAKEKSIIDDHRTVFRPLGQISYGDALRILVNLYGYAIPAVANRHWAEPYYLAAKEKGVDLPVTIELDSAVNRGHFARLAAAFRAGYEGKLVEYRMAEAGVFPPAQRSSSEARSEVGSSSSSSPSSSSSVAPGAKEGPSSPSPLTVPSRSHFLTLGILSDAIGDGPVRSDGEVASVRIAKIKLWNEVKSVDVIELMTQAGEPVLTLRKRTTTDVADYARTYEAEVEEVLAHKIPADTDVWLTARARVRAFGDDGSSDQLLQILSFVVTTYGQTTLTTKTSTFLAPFPKHQTAFGRITEVKRVGPETGVLASGANQNVTTFSFNGTTLPNTQLAIEELIFTPMTVGPVTTSNWKLKSADGTLSVDCTVGIDGVSCPRIADAMGLIGSSPLVLKLFADVSVPVGASGASLAVQLKAAGSPANLGSVHWTDHSGHFRWIESSEPVAMGTRWQN